LKKKTSPGEERESCSTKKKGENCQEKTKERALLRGEIGTKKGDVSAIGGKKEI